MAKIYDQINVQFYWQFLWIFIIPVICNLTDNALNKYCPVLQIIALAITVNQTFIACYKSHGKTAHPHSLDKMKYLGQKYMYLITIQLTNSDCIYVNLQRRNLSLVWVNVKQHFLIFVNINHLVNDLNQVIGLFLGEPKKIQTVIESEREGKSYLIYKYMYLTIKCQVIGSKWDNFQLL